MKKRKITEDIRKTINDLVRDYLEGKITEEVMFNEVWEQGKKVWMSLIKEYSERCQPFITEEDLEITAKEAIISAIKRLVPTRNPFSYIRRYVKGYLLEHIKKLAFPFSVHSQPVGEVERVSVDSFLDNEDGDVCEPCPEGLMFIETGFTWVEIKDMLNKVLSPAERQVAWMLIDGYNLVEISQQLSIPYQEVVAIVETIKEKLRKEL